MTLRRRLFTWLAIAALAATVVTSAVALLVARDSRDDQVLRDLRRQADALATLAPPPGGGVRLFVPGRRGRLVAVPARAAAIPAVRRRIAPLGEAVAAAGDGEGSARLGATQWVWVRRGDVAVARPAGTGADPIPIGRILLLSALGAALVAGLVALLATRALSPPLAALAGAARRLADGDARARAPDTGPQELADVARSFNAMADQLEAARDAEGRFLLAIAHELRTPLTALRGHAEAIADGVGDPRQSGRIIRAESRRMERLVRDLTDLARLEARAFRVALAPVVLDDVVDEAAARHAEAARERAVALEARRNGGGRVLADRERLLQVVGNLVDNGLRVAGAGGSVVIEARRDGLAVTDTGPGIDARDRPHAFERFYLHDRAGVDGPGGTGVGLAIAKELVDAMGGTIAAEDDEAAGARFVVRLRPA